jgi:hypothetical protein
VHRILTKTFPLVLLLIISSVVLGGTENDVLKLGLSGSVKNVIRERVKLETRRSRLIDGPRELVGQWTFNLQGLVTESFENPTLGTRRYDYLYYQDLKIAQQIDLTNLSTNIFAYEKRKVTKYFMTKAFGVLMSRDIYLYDENDRIVTIEHTCYYSRLCYLSPRVVKTYFKRDNRGRVVEETVFDAAGNAYKNVYGVHRLVTAYPDERTKEVSAFGIFGILLGRSQYKFDESGSEQEKTEFGPTFNPYSKSVVLERDDHHNWTKMRSFKITQVNGKTLEEPAFDEYRQISYY